MEDSKAQKQFINLGKLVVKELGLDPGVDTLSRWMAHYLAEQIKEAEREKNQKKKTAIEKDISDLIIKIWDRRKIRHDDLDPLKDINVAIKLLKSIEEKDQYNLLGRYSDQKSSQEPYSKFLETINENSRNISRAVLVLSQLPDKLKKARNWENDFGGIMTKEERELIASLNVFLENYSLEIHKDDSDENKMDQDYFQFIISRIGRLVNKINESFETLKKDLDSSNK